VQDRYTRIKKQVFDYYGRECKCCGEREQKFLTLDHLTPEVPYGKGGMAFYTRVKNFGFPNTIQVLCFNCNCGRSVNGGVCPHKQ